jgi:hypothetical protein
MSRTLVSSLVALLAVGCTWVSQSDYEDVRDGLDEDKDGTPYKDDCDDQDPSRGELDEIPYDAVDNDCSLGKDESLDPSDVDADGDNYAGISQEEYEARAKDARTPLEYPAIFVGRPLDCDDNDANVNPGKAIGDDILYDGIDTNCDQALDFDRDGDGYFADYTGLGVPIGQQDIDDFVARYQIDAATVDAWGPGGSGGPVPGDCEDGAAAYFPGSGAEVPYNQFDEDCDGSDDFDQDGDGHIPPGTEDAWDNWQSRYFLDNPPKPADDCADGPDMLPLAPGVPYRPLLDLATAADVHPGATDTWYDGLDSDCDGANDFDQDADGYIEDVNSAARDLFVSEWAYDDQPWAEGPLGDCDDTDATFRPGLLDTLWTSADEDCDGLVDTSYFNFGYGGNVASVTACPPSIGGFGETCWLGPSNPELLWFNDTQFALFASAAEFSAPGQSERLAGAAILFEEANAIGAAEPDRIDGRSWLRAFPLGAPQVLAPLIDLTDDAIPGSAPCTQSMGAIGNECSWLVAGGYGEGDNGELNTAVVYPNNNQFATQPQSRGITRDPMTVLHVDSASYEAAFNTIDVGGFVQCGPERLHGKLSSLVNSYESDLFPGDVCFFYGQPTETQQRVEVCNAGTCQVVEFTTAGQTFTAVPSIDVSADHWVWAEREGRATLFLDNADQAFVKQDNGPGDRFDGRVFGALGGLTAESIAVFDLAMEGTEYWLAGITTDGRVLVERYAAATDTTPERIELVGVDPSNPTYLPVGVAIAVGPNQVGVAVTLEDLTDTPPRRGSIGWTFLGRP